VVLKPGGDAYVFDGGVDVTDGLYARSAAGSAKLSSESISTASVGSFDAFRAAVFTSEIVSISFCRVSWSFSSSSFYRFTFMAQTTQYKL
jgi:hypothetical protein